MVKSYQESHVPKKNFIVKSYLTKNNLKGSQQKAISMPICMTIFRLQGIKIDKSPDDAYLGKHC